MHNLIWSCIGNEVFEPVNSVHLHVSENLDTALEETPPMVVVVVVVAVVVPVSVAEAVPVSVAMPVPLPLPLPLPV
jgi:hypothetical protein